MPNIRNIIIFLSLTALLPPTKVLGEQPDTISLGNEPVPSFLLPAKESETPNVNIESETSAAQPEESLEFQKAMLMKRYEQYRITTPDIRQAMPSPYIASWGNGGIYGNRSTTDLPGLMGIDNATITLIQNFGALNITAWADATKYGYFRGMQTSYGFGASLTYKISEKWSITAFGRYYTPLHPLTPAMAGMMNSSRVGGYASYNFNDHWGISVGAQATHSLVTNRWEARPIVTPYYRINKDVSIGVDVGGILYNIARDYIDNHNKNTHSPTSAGTRPVPIPRPNTRR